MNKDVWTDTNAKRVTAIVCATMLATPATTMCSVTQPQQEIDAPTGPSYSIELLPEFLMKTGIDPDVVRWVEFQALRRQWLQERGARASAAEMAMTPSYLSIIGMGPDVVPNILRQLRSEGDRPEHWFFALAAITRDNPVPPQSRGKVREMAKAWLDWGRTKDYV